MAEDTPDLRSLPKREAYQQLATHIDSVLDGITDPIAATDSATSGPDSIASSTTANSSA
jgi:hypothetical protein